MEDMINQNSHLAVSEGLSTVEETKDKNTCIPKENFGQGLESTKVQNVSSEVALPSLENMRR